MEDGKFMERPYHKDVMITEGFWEGQLDKIKKVTARDILDKFEHDYEDGIMKNMEWVCEGGSGKHIGPPWYDGLICEVIRGISDIIAVSGDEYLDKKIQYYTEKISQVQDKDPDGYINTYTALICPDKRWGKNGGSIIWQHETYNMGCLVEAGVHYYHASGNTLLLKCGVKAANCMCGVMGEAPLENIVPAHSLAEEALVKLYRLLKDNDGLCRELKEKYGVEAKPDDYLRLVCFWIDHRGVHHNRASYPHYMGEYAQDHCPIEEQSEAVGHAVRAALLYTGVAAAGMETGNPKYLSAAKRIWDNVEKTKIHISGGIGAIHNEERFGYQYDLPNDAYLETCAGVALAFWAGEMYRAFGDSNYMDVFEWVLYNNVLPGLSVDGTKYFYENPLVSDGTIERWDWHSCPCCPPMFLKLMGSLQDYIYAYGSKSIAVNLHIGSRVKLQMGGAEIYIEQKNCGLPWKGENHIDVYVDKAVTFRMLIRRPAWCRTFCVTLNGIRCETCDEKGYAVIEREWKNGDHLDIQMEIKETKVEAHPYVSADVGKVALTRGPLLYCLEEVDNQDIGRILLDDQELETDRMDLCGTDTVVIKGKTSEGTVFTAIPYYLWANRKKNKMSVWIKQKKNGKSPDEDPMWELDGYAAHRIGNYVSDADLTEWEGKLYKKYEPV